MKELIEIQSELKAPKNQRNSFGGLMTVPYRAMLLGRKGMATEINPTSYKDGLFYLRKAENDLEMPTLFNLEEIAI